MWKRFLLATTVLAGWTAGYVKADGLGVGDAAPKLDVKEFVKGDAVKEFEKGKTYVVEFWATWCGPCRTSIPHLTELQKKNKNVTFIGVSVWEQDPDKVKPFVDDMGAKMDYRVAMDSVDKDSKADKGKMAETWMMAAGQGGIPTAFIVNSDGKIAWIGHPISMEEPLKEIMAGTWDLEAAAKEFKCDATFTKARMSGDAQQLASAIEQAIANVEKNAQLLNLMAWTVVDPDVKNKPDAKLLELALKAAQKADKITQGKDAAVADTLAKAYFDNGQVPKAVETQERAVKLAKGTELEKDKSLNERLKQYQEAAKK